MFQTAHLKALNENRKGPVSHMGTEYGIPNNRGEVLRSFIAAIDCKIVAHMSGTWGARIVTASQFPITYLLSAFETEFNEW